MVNGGLRYHSGRSRDWIKSNNPAARAVKHEAEEDWGASGGADAKPSFNCSNE
jgi:hypothetical protein